MTRPPGYRLFPCTPPHPTQPSQAQCPPKGTQTAPTPAPPLETAAETSVTEAISRGHKRRHRHRHNTLPTTPIQITPPPTLTPTQLAARGAPTARKRFRTSALPGAHEASSDDSNDEWEEHVDLDEDEVAAGVAAVQNDAPPPPPPPDGASNPPPEPTSPADEEGDRRARARLRAAAARKKALRRHALHLLLATAHVLRLDAAAADEEVQAFAVSVAPEDVFLRAGMFAERLARLALWLRAEFRVCAMRQGRAKGGRVVGGGRLCSKAERAVSCVRERGGDVLDLVVVVAALVRNLGFRCRVVAPLQPVSFRVPGKVRGRKKVIDVKASRAEETVLYGWLEIWSPDSCVWTPLDVYDGNVGGEEPIEVIRRSMSRIKACDAPEFAVKQEPVKASSSRPRRSTQSRKQEAPEDLPSRKFDPALFAHVVAAENGALTDVTRRYTRNWREVEKARANGRVFERMIETLQDKNVPEVKDEAHKGEMAEFDALAAEEALPTCVTAFQKHPRYILERYLKKYEVIHPKFPIVGYVKEEPIFLRSNVRLLHTKDRWIRKMREVVHGASALKSVRSKNGTDDTVDLFGEWQTTPLIIPECVNGKVPRGVRGNVDLWTPEHLPKGTTHVNMAYARIAARKLGVDFAPAMTGFDIRAGRSVPKIEGVVVAAENGDLVRDAARQTASAAAERQETKAREEACERWLKLLRAVKARETVRKRYGGMFDDAGTYEAVQKREGLRRAREEKYGIEESRSEERGKTGDGVKAEAVAVTSKRRKY